jgi:hypothetical protein
MNPSILRSIKACTFIQLKPRTQHILMSKSEIIDAWLLVSWEVEIGGIGSIVLVDATSSVEP